MKALVLAGGSGTRFWPASRRRRPKQLLPLCDGTSFLRLTVDRLLPILEPSDIWICTGAAIADEVRGQVPEIPATQVLSEPTGRNTAPAIGWTLTSIPEADRDEVIVSLHSDAYIGDEDSFRATLTAAVEHVAEADDVMALGVRPRWAETGYGYMELGGEVDRPRGVRSVERFLEKPDAATARSFFESGRHTWNSGIFVFRIRTLLERLRTLEPRLMEGLEEISLRPGELADLYPRLPSVPIDTAVMERLDSMASLTLDCDWSDVGSWDALAAILASDDDGNAVHGDATLVDAKNNVLFSDGGTIAVLGVEGLAVVKTQDAVLVLPKERAQEVRRIVERLSASGRDALL